MALLASIPTQTQTAAAAAVPATSIAIGKRRVEYHPSTLDGLSFPLTIAHAIRTIGWCPVVTAEAADAPHVTIVLAGASRRAEQRIAACTPYLREVAAAIPSVRVAGGSGRAGLAEVGRPHTISFVLVGPEMQPLESPSTRKESTVSTTAWCTVPPYAGSTAGSSTDPLVRWCAVQGTLAGWLASCRESPLVGSASAGHEALPPSTLGCPKLHRGNTLLCTMNPGFGNTNDSLRRSWLPSLAAAVTGRFVTVCACANHDTDGLGEIGVWKALPLDVEFVMPLTRNPFAAMVSFVGPDSGQGDDSERAERLAASLGMSTVGDSGQYTANAYWYAVRGRSG